MLISHLRKTRTASRRREDAVLIDLVHDGATQQRAQCMAYTIS